MGAYIRARVFRAMEPYAIEVDAELESLSAAWCGECHTAIYDEWSRSSMGRARTNAVFVADWEHNGRSELCFKCHAPLLQQQPRRITALEKVEPPLVRGSVNPDYDPVLHDEGVTCVVCHVEDGVIVGPPSTGAKASPKTEAHHAFAKSDRLGSPDQCGTCHQLEEPPFTHMKRPVADVVGEWRRWTQLTGRTDGCPDCHMPQVERSSAKDSPIRNGRHHTFRGGQDAELLREGIEVQLTGDTDQLQVVLENRSGHNFPTGEPARAVEVAVELTTASGERLAGRSYWLERRVELPQLRERQDTSLTPAEIRTYRVDVPEGASQAHVRLRYHRLRNLPHVQRELQMAPTEFLESRIDL